MTMIVKGFSEKSDGSMRLFDGGLHPENIANRKRYFEQVGLGRDTIVAAGIIHGTRVETVGAASSDFIADTDALVTGERGIVLTITCADCFPVYLEERVRGIIGLAHCGWKGVTGNIIGGTVASIIGMGGEAGNISATIGPGICTGHFEIGSDVAASFAAYPDHIVRGDGIHVDLRGIMKEQIVGSGIPPDRITDRKECTYCLSDTYFSYRRDKPEYVEAQVAYIIRKD